MEKVKSALSYESLDLWQLKKISETRTAKINISMRSDWQITIGKNLWNSLINIGPYCKKNGVVTEAT